MLDSRAFRTAESRARVEGAGDVDDPGLVQPQERSPSGLLFSKPSVRLGFAEGEHVILFLRKDLECATSPALTVDRLLQTQPIGVATGHACYIYSIEFSRPWLRSVNLVGKLGHLGALTNAVHVLPQVQKPVLTIPAHLPKDTVTSLDWSHER